MLESINSLEQLWKYCDILHFKNYPNDVLLPIMGNGKISNPNYMFVFINPTYKNITSSKEWGDFRAPWIGTKYIWKIFLKANLFDQDLYEEIQCRKIWDVIFAKKVYKHLESRSFYFTNLVKWTGENADLPDKEKINLFLPILKREIELVQPKTIVAFGLMPFEALTGKKILLRDYFNDAIKNNKLKSFQYKGSQFNTEIIPCYFPVGRGNPKKAVELLKLLEN